MDALVNKYIPKEVKLYYPYISTVSLTKDFSLVVVMSEDLLTIREKYLSELNEEVLQLSIVSAIDDRI